MDTKAALKRLVITGACSLIPGLSERIQRETGLDVVKHNLGENAAWTGASLAQSLKLEGKPLTIQQFNTTSRVQDWSNVGSR